MAPAETHPLGELDAAVQGGDLRWGPVGGLRHVSLRDSNCSAPPCTQGHQSAFLPVNTGKSKGLVVDNSIRIHGLTRSVAHETWLEAHARRTKRTSGNDQYSTVIVGFACEALQAFISGDSGGVLGHDDDMIDRIEDATIYVASSTVRSAPATPVCPRATSCHARPPPSGRNGSHQRVHVPVEDRRIPLRDDVALIGGGS